MMKRALLALTGLAAFGLSSFAQPPAPIFNTTLFNQPSFNSPWLSLESQDRFFFGTTFGSAPVTEAYLPAFDPGSTAFSMPGDSKDGVSRFVELRPVDKIRFGGEFGFFYGKSTGSGFGREDYGGYVIGTVGNDKFSITAGYYRQETSFNGARFRR